MTLGREELEHIAAEWRRLRCLHAVFKGIVERFALAVPVCPDLESPVDAADPEALIRAEDWLSAADEQIAVHQLRAFLQTSTLSTEEGLRVLIQHQLNNPVRSLTNRDKLDFLLVQYFAQEVPSELVNRPPKWSA